MWKFLVLIVFVLSFIDTGEGYCYGDNNATRGCDSTCIRQCPFKDTPTNCCSVQYSCKCKHGYLYNPVIYYCVLPIDCPTDECPTDTETTTTDECPTETTTSEESPTTTERSPTTTDEYPCDDISTATTTEETLTETTTIEECPHETTTPVDLSPTTTDECLTENNTTTDTSASITDSSMTNDNSILPYSFSTVAYEFSLKFIYELLRTQPQDQNLFACPLATLSVLAAFVEFSRGPTLNELTRIFYDLSNDQILYSINLINQRLAQLKQVEFTFQGLNVLADDSYPLTPNFVNKLKTEYITAVNADLDNEKITKNAVNTLVKNETANRNGTDLTFESLSLNGPIAFVSALYFRSQWQQTFELDRIYTDYFYRSRSKNVAGTSYVPKTERCQYYYNETMRAKFIRINLQDGFYYLGILPDPYVTVEYILKQISKIETLKAIYEQMQYKNVKIALLNLRNNIVTEFDSLGVVKSTVGNITLFNENAQLSGVVTGNPPTFLNDGIQKSFLGNDFTGGPSQTNSSASEESFVVNRPSIFMLINEQFPYTPFFIGIIRSP